jgi:hypothetical protein
VEFDVDGEHAVVADADVVGWDGARVESADAVDDVA